MSGSDSKWTSDSAAYLKPQTGSDAWAQEAAHRGGAGGQKLLAVSTAPPPVFAAAALRLESGSRAVMRHRLITLDGRPVEIVTSWYPESLAKGTDLAQAKKVRGGTPTALARLGREIAQATEDVECRLPSPEEAQLLEMAPGDPVLVLVRLARDRNGEPVEVSLMITPSGERRLRYEMRVD